MKNNNEKGFALILSLLLLMVMSLMGGALIVITSGDHQSNNTSDQYQQTFYVAETALIEGEKAIINKIMGPWEMKVRNTEKANLPLNRENDDDGQPMLNKNSDCFKSFRNIDRANFLAANHIENQHFYQLIKGILDVDSNIIDTLEGATDKTKKVDAEILQIKRFYFEYFSTYIGMTEFKGGGSSLKKTSTNTQTQGHVYKIYGCGIMKGGSEGEDDEQPFVDGVNDILIPLETVIVVG
jgi:hypothetical protein